MTTATPETPMDAFLTTVDAALRTLLSLPDDYAAPFTAGGATTTEALLPLNFAAAGQPVDYVVTGHWGKTALKQAKPYAAANVAASSEADGFRSIPARASSRFPSTSTPRRSTSRSNGISPAAGDSRRRTRRRRSPSPSSRSSTTWIAASPSRSGRPSAMPRSGGTTRSRRRG